MADPPANIDFQFVNSTLSTPTVSQDLATRALIRKQAMKKASAARRRDGNYGKHNLRQYPVFLIDQGNDGMTAEEWERRRQEGFPVRAKESTSPTESNGVAKMKDARPNTGKIERNGIERQRWQPRPESVPPPLSPKRGYESVRMRTDFDLLDLSTLATLHIGRAVRASLSQNPYHLIHQLHSHKRWSYLTFLPQRYGQSKCLSDATDCVIARARQIISPGENWEAAVISCYVKALDSLQRALDCPRERFQPDVLAATEVLALYELLDPSGETAWVRHTAGAAKLVQLRGPKNYNTEFEKALFLAQTVPIMTESLLNGKRCFLEQKLWQKVMHSVIEEGLSSSIADRSDIVVGLLTFKSCIPGFFVDVTNLICIDPNPDIQVIEETASRIRTLRQNFLDWYSRYQNVLSQCKELYPGSSEYDSHCKVFANYLSCNMISSRLLAAISGKERAEVEKSVQALAGRMFLLEEEVKIASAQTIMFMAQTLAVAKATMVTAEDWLVKDDVDDGHDGVRSENGLVERWKFEKWAKAFGRKMPESEWELALDDGEPGRYNV